MFESDDEQDATKLEKRRMFLTLAASAVAGGLLWSLRTPVVLGAAHTARGTPGEVTIVQFSDDGKRLQKVRVAKVVKSEEDWKKMLSPLAFDITRHADTERAFTGQYWNLHEKGLYRCVCCDNALFSSDTKFESGTGWPSFWAPIAEENVRKERDASLGVIREAVNCTLCDAHLGHVFDDGPPPTGLRYCMNSASLKFVKRA
ncbi:MAG: peptide-methionine (R)-S-oxide reductase [Acidobacteria bacterium]|nr:MAG: peptide-methionine (R)-S-oxide reductase [Acidobacteriota bacterium]